MGRLRSLPARLGAAPARLASPAPRTEQERHARRDAEQHWRAWYKTARWQKLRWSVLVRDLFTCRRCGKLEGETKLLVADHRIPHRGDEALFWEAGNLQCLCKPCHDRDKQREEKRR
ncbi:HNH endonuclease signature motif containing protein [Frigidibacter sp. MR17.14]|uniref:HNH endonuclease n=1 Tax=Frigidibacter sp. MR17.14 TaxID=3126509 RepID=UPI003012F690